jgi:hypothetical protein
VRRVERDLLRFLHHPLFFDLEPFGGPVAADPGCVGRYRAIHHAWSQTPRGGDDGTLATAMHRIHRETDARAFGVEHR